MVLNRTTGIPKNASMKKRGFEKVIKIINFFVEVSQPGNVEITDGWTDGWTDRQAYRQTDIDGLTDRLGDRQAARQSCTGS
jgi:hypothetical protein